MFARILAILESGYIGGQFWTNGKSKFRLANADGVGLGFAFLSSDSDQATFSVISPTKQIVAILKGMLFGDLSKWELDLKQHVDIDQRVLKIFTAFISDFYPAFCAG